jgi:hypothetical protein
VRSGIWQPRFWQPEMRQGRAFLYEGALPIFLALALEMGGRRSNRRGGRPVEEKEEKEERRRRRRVGRFRRILSEMQDRLAAALWYKCRPR